VPPALGEPALLGASSGPPLGSLPPQAVNSQTSVVAAHRAKGRGTRLGSEDVRNGTLAEPRSGDALPDVVAGKLVVGS
jgi:hypothetical protein